MNQVELQAAPEGFHGIPQKQLESARKTVAQVCQMTHQSGLGMIVLQELLAGYAVAWAEALCGVSLGCEDLHVQLQSDATGVFISVTPRAADPKSQS